MTTVALSVGARRRRRTDSSSAPLPRMVTRGTQTTPHRPPTQSPRNETSPVPPGWTAGWLSK